MIDEDNTFILFGYTSDYLSHGSTKKVLKVCDICKEERLIEYRTYTKLCISCSRVGKHHTEKTKGKISNSLKGHKNHMHGKPHTEESKQKISNANCGNKHYMYGKYCTEEIKQKISNSLKGSKNPNWKGGKKLSASRKNAKRRELFGFISHNIPHENFHGHHVDFNHVIFIPKELHMSISHSVVNDRNMDAINDIVCDWYLEYQIIIKPISN